MEKYLDTTLTSEERAQDLLGKLSLEEKMGTGQLFFLQSMKTLKKRRLMELDKFLLWKYVR